MAKENWNLDGVTKPNTRLILSFCLLDYCSTKRSKEDEIQFLIAEIEAKTLADAFSVSLEKQKNIWFFMS